MQILPRPDVQSIVDDFINKKFGTKKERTFTSAWQLTKTPSPPFQSGKTISNIEYQVADDFGGKDAPKLKFLFTVLFELNDGYLAKVGPNFHLGSQELAQCAFALKTATRPNPTIEYQDVNYYNYRTKVATRMDFGPITINFYDDGDNKAQQLMALYTNAVSPIANKYQQSNGTNDDSASLETPIDHLHPFDRATVGTLENRMGIFKRIRVTHWFIDNTEKTIQPNSTPSDSVPPADSDVNYRAELLLRGNVYEDGIDSPRAKEFDELQANSKSLSQSLNFELRDMKSNGTWDDPVQQKDYLDRAAESERLDNLEYKKFAEKHNLLGLGNQAAPTTTPAVSKIDAYARINYDFINPKITTYQFDDLDMSASDVSGISVSFNCDFFTMSYEKVTEFTEETSDGKKKKKSLLQNIVKDELLAFKNIPQQIVDVGIEKGLNSILKGFP